MRSRGAALLALALLLALAGCARPVKGNRLNVLLITIETTRADHLGAWGYARPTSPRIDALARGGVVFERASTVSPRTNPSLASLMTSRYPHEHGVRNLFLPLESDALTLAEILDGAGYSTGAVQTHPRLVAASGFSQGFRIYDDDVAAHPLADRACAAARRWIEKASGRDRPWFLWIHLMDPHWPYEPPSPWSTAFGPADPRPAAFYQALDERRETIGPAIFRNRMPADEVRAFVDLYDGEIRFADEEIGRLLEFLGTSGLAARTLVVFTSDHGESLGEHDYFFEHGDFGTEPEVHVPLILSLPGRLPEGRRVPSTVRSIDVAPTILDGVGLPREDRHRGESLLPLLAANSGAPRDRTCFGETDDALHEENTRREVRGIAGKWRWIREGRYKMMHLPKARGATLRPLYDLESDPGETRDLTVALPAVAEKMGRDLDRWIKEDRMEEREYHVSPEAREVLRSLGYVN